MPAQKFSRNVHLVHGGLMGWCAHCSAWARHATLVRTIRKYGYATAVRRLNYIRNLQEHHPSVRRVMTADLRWMEEQHEKESTFRLWAQGTKAYLRRE
ncbi:MAG: hypothetical protein KGI89_03120 [Euryarchaeota archaeon]|nr:hypothetical protein [Euryarchaeota archaeon]